MTGGRDHRRFSWSVWVGTLIIASALWTAALLLARYDEGEAMARAERDTGNLAHVVAEQTARVIAEADQFLLFLGDDIREHQDNHLDVLHRQMRDAVRRSTILVQLALIDEEGKLAVTSVEGAPARVPLADREHFRVHLVNPDAGLFISKPVFGRASGKWSIQLTRRVSRPDGAFGGVLVASLDPFYFSRSLQEIDVGPNGNLAIVGTDGILRARSTLDDKTIGLDLGRAPAMTQAQRKPTGFLRTVSPVDGVARLQSFRVLRNYPLVVIAGFDEVAFLADTRRRQTVYLLVAAASTVALFGLALLAVRQSARLAASAAKLGESEKRFRDLAETASDWFWEMNADLRFSKLVGPLVPELETGGLPLGLKREEIAIREPGDEAKWQEHQLLLDRREPFRNFRYRVQTVGGPRYLVVSGRPVFTASGEFAGYRGSAADVTERELAARRLRSSEARYRAMFAAVEQPLITIDSRGVIDSLNAAAERLFGYRADEIVGQDIGRLMPPGQAAVHGAHLRSYLDSGRPHPVSGVRELVGRRKDGSEFPLEVTLADWRDGDRQYFTGALRDITAQREIESSLRRAKDAADQASRVKGEFLATMSHEIRTPMNGVLGALALVEGDNLNAEQRQLLEVARRSGNALLQIIDDILDLSKLEAGRVEVEPVDCELRALVHDALDLLRPTAAGRGLRLDLSVDPAVPDRLCLDVRRVRQVLVNLVGNAVKFTHRGGVSVGVGLEGSESGDGTLRLRFTVADTGIGIPEDVIPTLFRRFTQGDSSTTRRFGGTGLGLAICRELVTLMAGAIGVDSVEARGSTFWFTIPCRTSVCSPDAGPASPAAVSLRPLTVLVAEDNEVNREIVAAILTRAGHRAVTVPDGLQAIHAVRERRFDAVLMDVQMPVMDGITATRHIRAMPAPAGRVPIVALTGNAMPGHREEYLEAGMSAYLTKPIVSATLFETLAGIVEPTPLPEFRPDWSEAGPSDCGWRDAPLIDPVQVDTVRQAVGEEAWSAAVQSFGRTARQNVARLKDDIGRRDPGAVRLAHNLKGTSANMGAERLSKLAALLELESDEALLADAAAAIDGVLEQTLGALDGVPVSA